MASDAGPSHLLSVATSLATSFQPGQGQFSSQSQDSSLKGLASPFFPKSHCFSSWEGVEVSGELLAAQLPVPPFHAEDHLSLVRGLLPFMSQTRSQVLMLQFSVAASSHCCQGKISCLATPQSSSAGKTSTLLFIHGLKLPTASYGFLAGFLSPRCI